MFSFLNKVNNDKIIGIDFGSNSLKAMAISKLPGTYQVDAVAEVPIAKGLIAEGRLEDISKISAAIAQLSKNFPPRYKHAAIAISGTDVITKVMELNASLKGLELEAQVELEAENSIPFPFDEIFIDFEVVGLSQKDASLNEILVSAARKERVLSHAQCVDESGLKTKIVDIEGHALARAVNLVLSDQDYQTGIAVLDIGASQMMLNILHQGNVLFTRSKNIGGGTCTQMMAGHFSVSFQEAERIKIGRQWPDNCEVDVISPFISMILNHLSMDLRMFSNAANKVAVTKLILTGGATLMPELVNQLQETLEIDVQLVDPYLGFEFKNDADKTLLQQSGGKYMTALGLALRGVM